MLAGFPVLCLGHESHSGRRTRERAGRGGKKPYSSAAYRDASGTWANGTKFAGAVDLEKLITQDARFAPCLVKNLYSYALGRSSTYADEQPINAIVTSSQKNGFSMKQVIHDIVSSDPFRTQHPITQGARP